MREKTIPVSLGGARWRVPDAKTYVEVAGKLLVWAAKSKSAEARSQFAFLADLYEELVERAAKEMRGSRRPRKRLIAHKSAQAARERAVRRRQVETPAPQSP
jgi:hypothetical protein